MVRTIPVFTERSRVRCFEVATNSTALYTTATVHAVFTDRAEFREAHIAQHKTADAGLALTTHLTAAATRAFL